MFSSNLLNRSRQMKKINKLQAQNCAAGKGGGEKKNNKNLNKNLGLISSTNENQAVKLRISMSAPLYSMNAISFVNNRVHLMYLNWVQFLEMLKTVYVKRGA